MTLFEQIRQDHREIEEIMNSVEAAIEVSDAPKMRGEFARLARALTLHMRGEEAAVYGPTQELSEAEEEFENIGLAGEEDHHVSDLLLEELAGLSPLDERWKYLFRILRDMVQHHFEEEEEALFEWLELRFSEDELRQMAWHFARVKEEFDTGFEEAISRLGRDVSDFFDWETATRPPITH